MWLSFFLFVLFAASATGNNVNSKVTHFLTSSQKLTRINFGDFTKIFHCFFGTHNFDLKYYTPTKKRQTVSHDTNVTISSLNPNLSTKILLHGYCSNSRRDWIIQMKNKYLNLKKFNVIVVEWSLYSSNNYYKDIGNKLVEKAARRITDILQSAIEDGFLKLSGIHIIGHSAGAHCGGFVAQYLMELNDGAKIGRLSGLDASGPGYDSNTFLLNLNPTIAEIVDAIHTTKRYGYNTAYGSADFYVNGGISQPGCRGLTIACSHKRSYQLWAESIDSRRFIGRSCVNIELFRFGACKNNSVAIMGEHMSKDARGPYFLNTGDHSPYALGLQS